MAKKPQPQKEQLDTEDELLNFDLEELAGDEGSEEDEVIELLELVEDDQDEVTTRELALKNRLREKPTVIASPPAAVQEAAIRAPAKGLPEEKEAELDLSDLTLDLDVETTRPAQTVGDGDITEADLEDLLQETAEEEIAFDLSSEQEGGPEGKDEEVTDADLEALLQEATAERIEEAKEEGEALEIVSETEVVEEVQLEEEKAPSTDSEFVANSFRETHPVTEPLVEEEVQPAAQAGFDKPMAPEEPAREEIALGEPSVQKLVGISEERLEEIITKVVQDVVERVARETVASVAERVIGQAIEALRTSLEDSSEET